MSLQRAKEYLEKFNMADRVIEFDSSSATVAEAAKAAGCTEGEIAKTLSFVVDQRTILIVVAGDVKIDNGKYKAEYHTKAKMLAFDEVEKLIGHAVGGVCPFGIEESVDVYLDVSLKRFDMVYPACGSSNSAIKLTIDELEKTSGFIKWVDVCKKIENL